MWLVTVFNENHNSQDLPCRTVVQGEAVLNTRQQMEHHQNQISAMRSTISRKVVLRHFEGELKILE
jgi:hypothetical protein